MRKYITIGTVLVLTLFLIGCGSARNVSQGPGTTPATQAQNQVDKGSEVTAGQTGGNSSAKDSGELKKKIENELDAMDSNLKDIDTLGGSELDKGF